MVCNAFAVIDAEATPAFAFGGFEAGEQVEEGDGGGGVGGIAAVGWEGEEDCLWGPWCSVGGGMGEDAGVGS